MTESASEIAFGDGEVMHIAVRSRPGERELHVNGYISLKGQRSRLDPQDLEVVVNGSTPQRVEYGEGDPEGVRVRVAEDALLGVDIRLRTGAVPVEGRNQG